MSGLYVDTLTVSITFVSCLVRSGHVLVGTCHVTVINCDE